MEHMGTRTGYTTTKMVASSTAARGTIAMKELKNKEAASGWLGDELTNGSVLKGEEKMVKGPMGSATEHKETMNEELKGLKGSGTEHQETMTEELKGSATKHKETMKEELKGLKGSDTEHKETMKEELKGSGTENKETQKSESMEWATIATEKLDSLRGVLKVMPQRSTYSATPSAPSDLGPPLGTKLLLVARDGDKWCLSTTSGNRTTIYAVRLESQQEYVFQTGATKQ